MEVWYGALVMWFILTACSFIFVLYDQLTNTPSMRVMTLAWLLIIIYTGPFGLFIYFMSCRQPMIGSHDVFINVHWKQTVGSLIHCVAGDATAIIIMAALLSTVAITNGIEMIIEYIAAYLFGLIIFQAVFMRSMFDSYFAAIRKTIFAETVSMNCVMVGMFPVMFILVHYFPVSSNPLKIFFWGRMVCATIIGSFCAYPINSWMVAKKIKHGMMSRPQGGSSGDHGSHDHHRHHHDHMQMGGSVSFGKQFTIIIATYGLLVVAMWLTSFIVPIRF